MLSKYMFDYDFQGSDLLQTSLRDPSDRVSQATQKVFLPSFAMWASELGRLETDLIQYFVVKLEGLVKVSIILRQYSLGLDFDFV